MSSTELRYSVIVTVFNAEHTLTQLIDRIEKVMVSYEPYELLLIDDFSQDNSWQLLKNLKRDKSYIRLLRLTKNFGQAAATICGIRESNAPIIITIDDDLQYQPEDIPTLIEAFDPNKHYTLFGIPKRKRSLTSILVDKVINMIAFQGARHNLKFSSFRIFSRKTSKAESYNEGGMRSVQVFFNMVSPHLMGNVEVAYLPRRKGKSNYSFIKRLSIFFELLITITELPSRLFIYCSFLFLLLSSSASILILLGEAAKIIPFIAVIILFALFMSFLGFTFIFIYLRKMFLQHQGADVYAIWEEL